MFTELLVHSVEVYSRSGKTDRFGQPKDSNPGQTTGSPVATYPCRIDLESGGLALMERAEDAYERVWTMFTEHDVLIYEDDALRVLNADGDVLVNKAKVKVSERLSDSLVGHHREWTLIEQSGPNPERP